MSPPVCKPSPVSFVFLPIAKITSGPYKGRIIHYTSYYTQGDNIVLTGCYSTDPTLVDTMRHNPDGWEFVLLELPKQSKRTNSYGYGRDLMEELNLNRPTNRPTPEEFWGIPVGENTIEMEDLEIEWSPLNER